MFGFIRFVLWTSCAVAFGVFLGTADLGGKTPLQHLQGLYAQQQPGLDKAKAGAGALIDDVRQKVDARAQPPKRPTERYSAGEKAAIDQLIAKRPSK